MNVCERIGFAALLILSISCGKIERGDVVIPVGGVPHSPKSSEQQATQPSSGLPGNTEKGSQNQGSVISGDAIVAMSISEAKAMCQSCHQPGGSGAAAWDKAIGTEADWAAFAKPSKNSVLAGRMPLGMALDAQEKNRLIAFFDKLLGTPSNASISAPISFDFASARTLCTGCHSSKAPQEQRETPYLETEAQWRSRKSKISDEVRKGRMPEGKRLTPEERAALIVYIESL